MILEVTIPNKCLSTNSIYKRNRFGVYLSAEAKKYKLAISNIVRGKEFKCNPKTHYISTECYFYLSKFYTKDGKISCTAGDVDNFKKITLDAIAKTLGFNDAFVCDSIDKKRPGKEDKTIIILRLEKLSMMDIN